MKYSDELTDRCIKYYAEKHDHHISREEAEEYLDSFADLFLVIAGIKNDK